VQSGLPAAVSTVSVLQCISSDPDTTPLATLHTIAESACRWAGLRARALRRRDAFCCVDGGTSANADPSWTPHSGSPLTSPQVMSRVLWQHYMLMRVFPPL
jgi:hypothetical protein